MIIDLLITITRLLSQVLFLLILAYVILSFLIPQTNSFRRFVESIVEPLLRPIRKVVPPFQNIDFSPLILVILLQLATSLLVRILINLR
ncbi:MAG: YggT family protein [Anaerolineaceae bacterium]|nr:YggT family protein [Anaerolineaceae bacterium]